MHMEMCKTNQPQSGSVFIWTRITIDSTPRLLISSFLSEPQGLSLELSDSRRIGIVEVVDRRIHVSFFLARYPSEWQVKSHILEACSLKARPQSFVTTVFSSSPIVLESNLPSL